MNKTWMPTPGTSIQHKIGSPSQNEWEGKEKKGIRIRKEVVKLSLLTYDCI